MVDMMKRESEPLLTKESAGGTVAIAFRQPPIDKRGGASTSIKALLVFLDCVFLGLQPVLVHMSKNQHGGYSFSPVAVNFLTEVAKTVFALGTLLFLGTGRPGIPMYLSVSSFTVDAYHNRLLAFPALLYAINNYLKFSMQLFFRPTTTKMLGNLKIFSIALLMRTVMKRKFNTIQWEALVLLIAGITVNQLAPSCGPGDDGEGPVPFIPALLCTLGSVTVPSAASVYNEYALKKHMDTSVHLQNFFLYWYGLIFNLAAVLFSSIVKGQPILQMFEGQTSVTYLLIANNALQGILASFFYKFADSILKKYSSTVATIFTALMSFALFGHPLTANSVLGISIVFISMHQFFTFGDKPVSVDKGHHGTNAGILSSRGSGPKLGKSSHSLDPSAHVSNGAERRTPMSGRLTQGASPFGAEEGLMVGHKTASAVGLGGGTSIRGERSGQVSGSIGISIENTHPGPGMAGDGAYQGMPEPFRRGNGNAW